MSVIMKPTEVADFHDTIDEVDDGVEFNRRTLIAGVALLVSVAECVPMTDATAGGMREHQDGALKIRSTPGLLQHVHDLFIPYADLEKPPERGVVLMTTEAMFHQHNIVLSREELVIVSKGGTVTQRASSHLFVIALARGLDRVHAG